MYRYCLIFSVFLLHLSSCSKKKLNSPNAMFFVVNDTQVQTTSTQGTNSHKITDIWLYVNDNFQGVYPIGKVMPIASDGNVNILMLPGIKNNGISATRLPYPFYNGYRFSLPLTQQQTFTITPTFNYLNGCLFPINDAFDVGGSQFYSTGDSAYFVTYNPALTFGGVGGSVFLSMSDAKPTAKMRTSLPMGLPTGGAAVYLELNFKCNQPFKVGVIGGNTEEREALTINTSTEWNKIYVSLTSVISNQPTYNFYDVIIYAKKEVANPKILIDNVKLVILP